MCALTCLVSSSHMLSTLCRVCMAPDRDTAFPITFATCPCQQQHCAFIRSPVRRRSVAVRVACLVCRTRVAHASSTVQMRVVPARRRRSASHACRAQLCCHAWWARGVCHTSGSVWAQPCCQNGWLDSVCNTIGSVWAQPCCQDGWLDSVCNPIDSVWAQPCYHDGWLDSVCNTIGSVGRNRVTRACGGTAHVISPAVSVRSHTSEACTPVQ